MDNNVDRKCTCHHEDGSDTKSSISMTQVKKEEAVGEEEIDDKDDVNMSIFNSSSTSIETVIHAPVQSQVVNSSTAVPPAFFDSTERMTDHNLINDTMPLGWSASTSASPQHLNSDFGGLCIPRRHDGYGNNAICHHHHHHQYHHQPQMQTNGPYSCKHSSNDHTYFQPRHHCITHHHPHMQQGMSQGFYDRPLMGSYYAQWRNMYAPYYSNPSMDPMYPTPFYSTIPGVDYPLPRYHEHVIPHPYPHQGCPPQYHPGHGSQQPGPSFPQPPPRANPSNEEECLAMEILEFFNSSMRQLNQLMTKVDSTPCLVPLKEMAASVRQVQQQFTRDFLANGHRNHGPTYCSLGPVKIEIEEGGRTTQDPFILKQDENRNKSRKRQKLEIKTEQK